MTKKLTTVPAYKASKGNTRIVPPNIPFTIAITTKAGCIELISNFYMLNKTILINLS